MRMSYNENMNRLKIQASSDTVILAGGIIDNVHPGIRPNVALFIRNGVISEVREEFDASFLEDTGHWEVVDLRKFTLLPGLIDPHVHLALDGVDFKAALSRWEEGWKEQAVLALANCLEAGVLAIRDGGDKEDIGLKGREMVERGEVEGPRVLACGRAVGKKGLYGWFLGPGIETVEEGKKLIDEVKAQGVDCVKILVSGIVSFKEYGKVGAVQFSQSELDTLVDYAHSLGLPVMAHASSDEAVRRAAYAGVDSVEHGYFVSSASLAVMAERAVPWVPTVVPVAIQSKPPVSLHHTAESVDVIKRTYELQLKRIEEARRLGVTIGIGTDAGAVGVLHGSGIVGELELFAEAGFSTGELIKGVTLTNAQICGLAGEMGSIETGKKPVLIAVKEDPLKTINSLKHVQSIIY